MFDRSLSVTTLPVSRVMAAWTSCLLAFKAKSCCAFNLASGGNSLWLGTCLNSVCRQNNSYDMKAMHKCTIKNSHYRDGICTDTRKQLRHRMDFYINCDKRNLTSRALRSALAIDKISLIQLITLHSNPQKYAVKLLVGGGAILKVHVRGLNFKFRPLHILLTTYRGGSHS